MAEATKCATDTCSNVTTQMFCTVCVDQLLDSFVEDEKAARRCASLDDARRLLRSEGDVPHEYRLDVGRVERCSPGVLS
jgi:hypothetical protein